MENEKTVVQQFLAAFSSDQRLTLALRKRAMERALREQGHSAGFARAMVAEHFREKDSSIRA